MEQFSVLPFSFLVASILILPCFFFFFSASGRKKNAGGGAVPPLPPGPRGWPVVGNLLQLGKRPHRSLHDMSLVHGDLMHLRIGSVDFVVASSARTAELLLKTHDAVFGTRPVSSTSVVMAYNSNDIAFAPYGPRWRTMRGICSLHLFSPRAIEETRRARAEEVAAMVRRIGGCSGAGGEAAVQDFLTECTGNNLSRVIVGKRLFGEGSSSAGEYKEIAGEIMELAGAFVIGDYVGALRWLDIGGVVAMMKRAAKRHDEFLDAIIVEHRSSAGGCDRKVDMLSKLLELKDDADGKGAKLTDVDIKGALQDMFVAGTDTSSGTVEWALSELVRHPEMMREAQAELDSVVGRGRLVAETDVAGLHYLRAVVTETFRLHPVATMTVPHMAGEACDVDGYGIPEGSIALVSLWAIGRDPKVWEDPLEFRPERFIAGRGREKHSAGVDVVSTGKDFELIPFGAGRRACVGMNLGLRMVQLMLASLVHAFEWGFPAGMSTETMSMEEEFGLNARRAVPLVLCPKPRLHENVYH